METGIFSRTYETKDLEETWCRMMAHGIRHTQFNLSNAGLLPLPEEISDEDLLRSTETVLRYAEENNVILGAEPEAGNIINTPERARRYLDAVGSPYLKIIMDGANLFRPEQVTRMTEVLQEAFALLGDDIVLAHAKDFTCDGRIRFAAAGKGILDYALYTRLLEETGYHGALILHGLAEEEVPDAVAFLKGCKDENRNQEQTVR